MDKDLNAEDKHVSSTLQRPLFTPFRSLPPPSPRTLCTSHPPQRPQITHHELERLKLGMHLDFAPPARDLVLRIRVQNRERVPGC